jgi:hypothetical protein
MLRVIHYLAVGMEIKLALLFVLPFFLLKSKLVYLFVLILRYIEVRRIDAARDIAETLARSRNVAYLPSSGGGGGDGGGRGLLLKLDA